MALGAASGGGLRLGLQWSSVIISSLDGTVQGGQCGHNCAHGNMDSVRGMGLARGLVS